MITFNAPLAGRRGRIEAASAAIVASPQSNTLRRGRATVWPRSSAALLISLVLPGISRAQQCDPRDIVTEDVIRRYSGQFIELHAAPCAPGAYDYQWYRNGAALIDDGRISGSTSPVLRINDLVRADTGQYSVVATAPPPSEYSESGTAAFYVGVLSDSNCDGVVDNSDIDLFVLALLDQTGHAWRTRLDEMGTACDYPDAFNFLNDTNQDGVIDNGDIDWFIYCVVHTPPSGASCGSLRS